MFFFQISGGVVSFSPVEMGFRTKDKTGDGQLDKDEFWRFIGSIGGIAKEASCLVSKTWEPLWEIQPKQSSKCRV